MAEVTREPTNSERDSPSEISVSEPREPLEIPTTVTDIVPRSAPIAVNSINPNPVTSPSQIGGFDLAAFKPFVDGLQAGSWAIVLMLFFAVYAFRGRFERIIDGLIVAIDGVKENSEDNKKYQAFINQQTKKLIALRKEELTKISELDKRLELIERLLIELKSQTQNRGT
jgi:hypothetical protein